MTYRSNPAGISKIVETQVAGGQLSLGTNLTSVKNLTLTGQAAKALVVNSGGTGFELATMAGGTSMQVQFNSYTTSGTWTKQSWAKMVLVQVVGGGAGGASGIYNPTSATPNPGCAGGTGGHPGSRVELWMLASDIGATETITIGAGGTGGTGGSGSTGSIGAAGGASSFGALVVASGGPATPATVQNQPGTVDTQLAGNWPAVVFNNLSLGANGGNNTPGANSQGPGFGGGGGGFGGTSTGTVNGLNGGNGAFHMGSTARGMGAGGVGTANTGGSAAGVTSPYGMGGGGAGGAGLSTNIGGLGGNGAQPGGGGGGGGSSRSSTGGKGGNGGAGIVRVWQFG